MANPTLKIEYVNVTDHFVDIKVRITNVGAIKSPHVSVRFDNGFETRRLRLESTSTESEIIAEGKIDLYGVFYNNKSLKDISLLFFLSNGVDFNVLLSNDAYKFSTSLVSKRASLFKVNNKEKIKMIAYFLINFLSLIYRPMKVKNNRVTFLSNRTDVPTGNLAAVLKRVEQDKDIDVRVFCHSGGKPASLRGIFNFLYLYNTSKAVFVDDYYHLISFVKKKDSVTLIQLWHACGAFKTFGFSRLGTEGQLVQTSRNHRQYDFALASSKEVAPCYAEGFGISDDKILSFGSPRCDVLCNEKYKIDFINDFYSRFPKLKGKKIILFAPTFRGGGNGSATYPFEKFNIKRVMDDLGDDYALLIKMHPYLDKQPIIDNEYKDRVINCENEDVNSLFFVTDLLITDYSSVIYEAALMNVPMLFYAFDLQEYSKNRDFYIDFECFVPGKIVKSEDELVSAVKNEDFCSELLAPFRSHNFGDTVGKACDNVYDFLKNSVLGDKNA